MTTLGNTFNLIFMFDAPILPASPAAQPATRMQRSFGRGFLQVKSKGGRSRIADLYQQGCAKIRLPRQHGAGLEAVMINSSGGLTGGDRMAWQFTLDDDSELTVTSQACERIYKASADIARSDIALKLGENARLNWLPQETILFDRSSFNRSLSVDMAANATLLLGEAVLFGRQRMGESVKHAFFHDRWRIRRDGNLIHAEDMGIEGDAASAFAASTGTNSHPAIATLLLVSPQAEMLLEPVRQIIGDNGGASFWQGKLAVRLTAASGHALRAPLIAALRLLNDGATLPKVWHQ
ncbi:urease accessory protein UreD [Pseudahrensia aquimaris]|uniref:Urease accessory protein UreD n=1 Tax=Pseudahrensia aquimaris TaxID=744461 RepID=A0ABW3FGY8_9HYPH